MLRHIARFGTLLATLGASFLPAGAIAQQRIALEGQGGIAIPGKQLHQFENAGPGANLEVDYRLSSRLMLDAYGAFDRLTGQTVSTTIAPDLDVMNYGIGIKANLVPTTARHWRLLARVGVGGSTIRSDKFAIDTTSQFDHTYPSTMGGLQAGYQFRSGFGAFVGTDIFWTFAKQDDTSLFHGLNPATIQAFSKAWTAPIMAGVQVAI